jgi:hypothetical protein
LDTNLLTLRIHLKISHVTIIVRELPDIQLTHRDKFTGSHPRFARYFGLSDTWTAPLRGNKRRWAPVGVCLDVLGV